MLNKLPPLLAVDNVTWLVVLGVCVVASLMGFVLLIVATAYGKLWFQAYMSRADVSIWSLIGMGFRQVKATMIVTAKVMVRSGRAAHRPPQRDQHVASGGSLPGGRRRDEGRACDYCRPPGRHRFGL